MTELFVANQDTSTHRVCGTCGEKKTVSEFYKDGKDTQGNPKYRRDCKDCYKSTRMKEAKVKAGKKK